MLTPLELVDKIAALVSPLRAHRRRYYGLLAPDASLRAAGAGGGGRATSTGR